MSTLIAGIVGRVLGFAGLLLAAIPVTAQPIAQPDQPAYAPGTQPAVALPRLSGTIVFDGRVDEPAWEAVAPLPLVMYAPTYRGAITDPTEVRVAYDDDYVYLAGRLGYVDPADMRGNSLYRDRWSGDDTFAIIFDPFNDNENALWFYTTPLGTRFDLAVSDDAALGRNSTNNSWNTHWDAESTVEDGLWQAEIRIPFSSLGFQTGADGRVVMGMIVYRWLAHNNHRYIYPDIPPNWERGSNKPSVAQDVILENVYSRKPIYVTPYALGGVRQVAGLNDAGTAYTLPRDPAHEIGLDIKYNVTSNLTLDVTANTDFAQVEADDQQINLTRFSLFFPEKRQFFQERAGIFEFDAGMNGSRLFHSRRIGLANDGPIRIWGGGRLVGRVGDWDVGMLDMQTASERGLPADNFGVLRLRRRVFNPHSTAGGIVTSRIGQNGRYNLTYGLDGVVRVAGEEYLTLKWMETRTDDASAGLSAIDRGRTMLKWERRSINGLSYDIEFTRSGRAFDPGVGFVQRSDVTYLSPDINYQAFRGEDSRFRRVWVGNWSYLYARNADGSIESAWLHPFYWFELKGGAMGLVSTDHQYEDVPVAFNLSEDVSVPAGRYWFHGIWLEAGAPNRWYFRPVVEFIAGSFYDGWKTTCGLQSTWNISRHFELGGNYELNVIRFPERDQRLDTHLPQLRIQMALDTHLSVAVFVQYNSLADAFNVNTRLRYHFREGHDLWVVYNEGVNTDRDNRFGPRLPATDSRAVLFKYTYTFSI